MNRGTVNPSRGVKILTHKKDENDKTPFFYLRFFDIPDFIEKENIKKLYLCVANDRIYFSKEPMYAIDTGYTGIIFTEEVTVQVDDKSGKRNKVYIYHPETWKWEILNKFEGGYGQLMYSQSSNLYYIDLSERIDVPRSSRLIHTYYGKKEEDKMEDANQKENDGIGQIFRAFDNSGKMNIPDNFDKTVKELVEDRNSVIGIEPLNDDNPIAKVMQSLAVNNNNGLKKITLKVTDKTLDEQIVDYYNMVFDATANILDLIVRDRSGNDYSEDTTTLMAMRKHALRGVDRYGKDRDTGSTAE